MAGHKYTQLKLICDKEVTAPTKSIQYQDLPPHPGSHSSYSQIHKLFHACEAVLQRTFLTPLHVCRTLKLLSWAREEHGCPVGSIEHLLAYLHRTDGGPHIQQAPSCPSLIPIDLACRGLLYYSRQHPGHHPKWYPLTTIHTQLSPRPHNYFSWRSCVTLLGLHSPPVLLKSSPPLHRLSNQASSYPPFHEHSLLLRRFHF